MAVIATALPGLCLGRVDLGCKLGSPIAVLLSLEFERHACIVAWTPLWSKSLTRKKLRTPDTSEAYNKN
jgi:hypothetical protein